MPGNCDEVGRSISTEHPIAALGEFRRIAAGSASGVEEGRTGFDSLSLQKCFDEVYPKRDGIGLQEIVGPGEFMVVGAK